jgi:hypothetical protein
MIQDTVFSPSVFFSVLTTHRCVLIDCSGAISRTTIKCEDMNIHPRSAGEGVLIPKGVCEFRFGTYASEEHPV